MTSFFENYQTALNQALDKLPNSSYNSDILYRIENLADDQLASIYKEGEIFSSKAFTSTTYSEEALIDAMRNRQYTILLRIRGKNGKLIEESSTLSKEKEILFKSGTQYKVDKIGQSANPADDYQSFVKTIWLSEL